jgi:uncharacterized membrane protein (DUF4010 family)
VVAACTVLVPRVLVISTMLNPAVGMAAIPVLGPAFLAGLAVIGFALWRERTTRPGPDAPRNGVSSALGQNPLGLMSALQMAVAFQLVLFAIAWVQSRAGQTGVLASATLLGLTDVDALTVSMTRYGTDDTTVRVAAAAMGIGVLSNTALKLGLAIGFGGRRYRIRAAAGLLILAAGLIAGLALGWP